MSVWVSSTSKQCCAVKPVVTLSSREEIGSEVPSVHYSVMYCKVLKGSTEAMTFKDEHRLDKSIENKATDTHCTDRTVKQESMKSLSPCVL